MYSRNMTPERIIRLYNSHPWYWNTLFYSLISSGDKSAFAHFAAALANHYNHSTRYPSLLGGQRQHMRGLPNTSTHGRQRDSSTVTHPNTNRAQLDFSDGTTRPCVYRLLHEDCLVCLYSSYGYDFELLGLFTKFLHLILGPLVAMFRTQKTEYSW